MTSPRVAAFALALAACQGRPRPWQGRPDGGVRDESQPFLPGKPAAPAVEAGQGGAPSAGPAPRAGGLWVSCATGFVPSGEPRKDARRLGLACGPENGMRRVGGFEATASADADRHPLAVQAGACYRLFAVGDAGAGDLAVTVVSPRGSELADASAGPVAMVERERPFCSFGDDQLTIEVRARGKGRYALEIYQLPASP